MWEKKTLTVDKVGEPLTEGMRELLAVYATGGTRRPGTRTMREALYRRGLLDCTGGTPGGWLATYALSTLGREAVQQERVQALIETRKRREEKSYTYALERGYLQTVGWAPTGYADDQVLALRADLAGYSALSYRPGWLTDQEADAMLAAVVAKLAAKPTDGI
jgi:hypothetical protein